MNIDAHLSERVRELRKARAFTLEQLAELSGVSRSMISLIERQETSPTAAVLNKLADALGVSLPALFATDPDAQELMPVSRRADQPIWTDPASGYVRRHLSPAGTPSPIELVEVNFPAQQSVVFDNPVRKVGVYQQLWMLKGDMDITVGEQTWSLSTGDCLAMELGHHIRFHNPTQQAARYLLALTSNTDISRKPT